MAEVVITTRVNNELVEKSVNTFKDLKREIRASKDELLKYAEGSEDFKRVQQNVSKLQTSLKDLGDTAKIQGSGVERLQQSFSLLGESFRSGDLDKGKIAMTGLGQAVSAIPIFLLVEGISLVIQNFDKIIEFIPGIKVLVDAFHDLTDAIGLTNIAQTKLLDENIAKTKEATIGIINYYDKEIALLKAAGQETFLIEQAKREEYAKSLQFETAALAQKVIINGDANGELTKQLKDLDKEYKKTLLEQEVAEIEHARKIEEERRAAYEKQQERLRKETKDILDKLALEEKIFYQRQGEELKREAEKAALLEKQRLDAENAYLEKQKDLDKQFAQLEKEQKDAAVQAEIDRNKKLVEDKKKSEAAKVQAVNVGFAAAQTLSQAYFQTQLNQAKGNANEELKVRKQMFEVDKAFNIARAIQDGIRSVQASLTIPPPGGQILAVANGALAAANIAKIAATKFDGASVSGTTDSGINTSTSLPTSQAPINTFNESGSTLLQGGNGTINQTNQPLTVRAIVVETDITQSQNTVSKERRTATFG